MAASAASSSSASAAKAAIGILSIGDMGMGVAKLLLAHGYPVFTTAANRSQHTKDRIKTSKITDLPSDEALVIESDIILSIVPPRDAVATARRIHSAVKKVPRERAARRGGDWDGAAMVPIVPPPLLYMDLNAISPRTTRTVQSIIESPRSKSGEPGRDKANSPGSPTSTSSSPTSPSLTRRLTRTLSSAGVVDLKPDEPPVDPITVDFLDGGIIGGPPQQQQDKTWKKPSIVVSGPHEHTHLSDVLTLQLQSVLNMRIVSEAIGAASTLKSTFAIFSKGTYALAIASFTTAHTAGVLSELKEHLQHFSPDIFRHCERGVTSMPPKAYRWVEEMRQIGETLADEGHLGPGFGGKTMFDGVSDIYRMVADDTVLGQELTHKRKRGTTLEDVAEAVRSGLEDKRVRKDEKLDLAWRGSWS